MEGGLSLLSARNKFKYGDPYHKKKLILVQDSEQFTKTRTLSHSLMVASEVFFGKKIHPCQAEVS
jgi:hypothetical protein